MKVENEIQDKTEIVKQSEIQKQKVLVGKVKLHTNHKLFEFDLETQKITIASFESQEVHYQDAKKGLKKTKKLTVKKECLYIGALNEKNVKKVLKRNYGIVLD